MLSASSLFLAFGAGFCFMLANVGTKFVGTYSPYICVPAILLVGICGILLQIEALKTVRLGHIIMLVIASEVLLSIGVAWYFFAESYTLRDGAGIALVVLGVGLLSAGEASREGKAEDATGTAAVVDAIVPHRGLDADIVKGPRLPARAETIPGKVAGLR